MDVLGVMDRTTAWGNEVGVVCCPGDPATTVAPPNMIMNENMAV